MNRFEIDINKNITRILKDINGDNLIDSCKVLKVKYGISYKVLAKACKINQSTFRSMIQLGYYTEDTAIEGATNLKNYFLGKGWV